MIACRMGMALGSSLPGLPSLSVVLNSIPENSSPGFVVGQATSPEASPTFSLPNDDSGNFAIHASTGQITLTSAGATAFDGQGADTRTITVSDGTSTTGNLSVAITAAAAFTADSTLITADTTVQTADAA